MPDETLIRLIGEAAGPFPPGLAGVDIGGVDLVLLDDAIMGTASHYERNSRPLSADHRALLDEAVQDLDRIWGSLPTDDARSYFARARAVGVFLLERRGGLKL